MTIAPTSKEGGRKGGSARAKKLTPEKRSNRGRPDSLEKELSHVVAAIHRRQCDLKVKLHIGRKDFYLLLGQPTIVSVDLVQTELELITH